jgi:antitoxin HicB
MTEIMTTNHHGSSLEKFLAEEGILEEVGIEAIRKVIALRIAEVMKKRGLTKTAMADQMAATRVQIDLSDVMDTARLD